jgi:hypothetical protein
MITRRKFLATTASGLMVPALYGAGPVILRRTMSPVVAPPDMLWQTTRVTPAVFNPTITKTGLAVTWDYGDGTARDTTNTPSHTYANAGTKNVGIYLNDAASKVTQFYCNSQNMVGAIPAINAFTALVTFNCYINQLTGSIPSLTANTALVTFYCSMNQLTGSIPSLTANTALVTFNCSTNQISGYTASTLATTLNNFQAHNNLLTQTAVSQILADFVTNLAARPASGTINLGGTGNAAPSAQGLLDKAAIIQHGVDLGGTWAVTTN